MAHSLSPLLHRTAYVRLGLDWSYTAHDVTAETLPAFLDGLDESWRGLSLTMPLKRAVLPLLDEVDATALTVGAVNTVLLTPGHRHGLNTDVTGLVVALEAAGAARAAPANAHAVVVGGGATAASALASLAALGVGSAQVRVRDVRRADATVQTGRRLGMDVRVLALDAPWRADPPVTLVVSTVPSDVAAAVLPDAVLAGAVVADVRYDPWPSVLLQRAGAVGAATATGIDLLVHQAVEQVRLMTGLEVEAEPLLEIAVDEVRRRAGPGGRSG